MKTKKKTIGKLKLSCMIPIHAPILESIYENKRDADKARVILHYLFHTRQRMKDNPNFASGLNRYERWCPVYSTNLKAMIHDYKRILDILLHESIIEFKHNSEGNPSFFPNKYTILYRIDFPMHLLHPDTKRYRKEEITTPSVIRSVKKHFEKGFEMNFRKVCTQYPWLKRSVGFIKKLQLKPLLKENTNGNIEFLEMTSNQFNNGLYRHISIDDYAGRVFTHLSNLPKVLRKHLEIEGSLDPLVIVDVKNAQPYLIALVLNYPHLIQYTPELSELYPVLEKFSKYDDVKHFFRTCATGRVYDDIAIGGQISRDEVKTMMLKHVLFCSKSELKGDLEESIKRKRFQNTFKSLYPNVFEALTELKSLKKKNFKFIEKLEALREQKLKAYAIPSLLGMRLEVAFFIKVVAKNCDDSQLEIATIHDAFILRKADLNRFILSFNSVFELLNVPGPTLDIQQLQSET
jgi:hypothetical protein